MIRPVFAVALADLRERSRSTMVLVVPVLVAYFVKVVTIDTTLVIAGGYTGRLTVAWVAGMTTVIGTTAFFLFGFSFVSGSVARDRETAVSDLIASSPITNRQYLLGKWLSNFGVLALATGVLLGATGVAFLVHGTGGFDFWALVSPFLLIALPTMTLVAAVAVCFEATRLLRGTVGTVVYFTLALVVFTVGLIPGSPLDVTGIGIVRESMVQAIAAEYPKFEPSVLGFAYTDNPGNFQVFAWDGIAWTASTLATRVPILGVAAGFLVVATVTFDRFDGSNGVSRFVRRLLDSGEESDDEPVATSGQRSTVGPQSSSPAVDVDLAPVSRGGFATGRVLAAEIRMALRGHPWWWYVACCLALAATGLAPVGTVRSVVVPAALLLPLSAWSALGARERMHRTEELVFVGTRPLQLLAAMYAMGVLLGLLVTVPAPVRYVTAGMHGALLGWAAGVLFLPATALATGIWTGRPKAFEISYLTAWYLGPVNRLHALDYLGASQATVERGIPLVYLGLTVLALGVAVIGRRRS